MSDTCANCNKKLGTLFGAYRSNDNPELCDACDTQLREERAKRKREEAAARVKLLVDNMKVTTAFSIAGAEIETELDIVTAECAFGMNVFRDMFAGMRDIVGGRSEATQKVLRDARKTCLAELKKEAASIGADAVIGVDLDYSEFSGGGKSMLLLVASGTAVKLKK
jgi:uncharacterized protein YbjQ (UPF0145 family)